MKTKSIVTLGGAAAALAALFLAACSGGGGNAPAPVAPAVSPAVVSAASGTVAVPYASGLLAGAQYAGPASFATRTIDVVTNPADESALYAYAAAVNDPASPVFHQFLTPQQIADRFGPTASQYAAAQAYFAGFGLATHGYAQRSEIAVTGTQAQLQAALGATFGLYKSAGTTFVALASAPHLPASLHVSAVRNAVDLETQMYVLPNPEGASTSLAQSLKPQQVQRAFDFTGAYAAGFSGSGVTVAVLGTGQTTPADVTALSARYGVPAAPLVYVPVASASAPPTSSPLSYATANGCMDNDNFAVTPPCIADGGEARIDTQTVAMLAPAATMLYYLGYASNTPDSIAELNQIASDNLADVVSMSVGSCEPTSGTPGLEPAIATLAAAGVAMFASVGDNAVWPNSSPCRNNYAQGVIYPSTDPNVVAVGAVYLPVDAAGDLTGQIVPWGFQDTNGNSYRNSAGSGGGYSGLFTPPPYQSIIPAPLNNGGRMVPDIMMAGDPHSALANIGYAGLGGPTYGGSNGTSEAAPEAAGAWALVLQACRQTPACASTLAYPKARGGSPNYYYYGIYAGTGPFAGRNGMTYGNVFYDITYGNNTVVPGSPSPAPPYIYGYNAGPGYDLASGLGVPLVGPLIRAVTGLTNVP